MGVRCSVLGHTYETTEYEENRTERAEGTVLVCREYQVCRRCGDREELYRNEKLLEPREDQPDGSEDSRTEENQSADATEPNDETETTRAETEDESPAAETAREAESQSSPTETGTTVSCDTCGEEWVREATSLRNGDLCPECQRGYVNL